MNCKDEVTELTMRRLGIFRENRDRAILMDLTTWNRTMHIMNETKKLKGTKICINEDYPKGILDQRK